MFEVESGRLLEHCRLDDATWTNVEEYMKGAPSTSTASRRHSTAAVAAAAAAAEVDGDGDGEETGADDSEDGGRVRGGWSIDDVR